MTQKTKISRRQFLAGTAAAIATPMILSAPNLHAETLAAPLWRFEMGTVGSAVAFTMNGGSVLVSGGHGCALVDSGSGALTHVLSDQFVSSVACSPDGTQIITGTREGAKLWDASSGKPICTFAEKLSGVTSVSISADGSRYVTGGFDGRAILWDSATRMEVHTLTGHIRSVSSVAFSPDGRHVLTGSGDNTAKLWDATTGEEVYTYAAADNEGSLTSTSPDGVELTVFSHVGVTSVAFSPDGTHILVGSGAGDAVLWNVEKKVKLRAFTGHTEYVGSVGFSPDGSQVLTGAGDRTVILWDANTGKRIRVIAEYFDDIGAVAFSPDGTSIAILSGATATLVAAEEANGELTDIAERLMDNFGVMDRDRNGVLSFAEAQFGIPSLREAPFDFIDTDKDGQLSRIELAALETPNDSLPVSPISGCRLGQGDFFEGVQKAGDALFLIGIALLTVVSDGVLRRRE
jgi:WD40 repeat protein